MSGLREEPSGFSFQDSVQFTLKTRCFPTQLLNIGSNYLDGICAAPDAGNAGMTAAGVGAVTGALSSTLPELATGRAAPK